MIDGCGLPIVPYQHVRTGLVRGLLRTKKDNCGQKKSCPGKKVVKREVLTVSWKSNTLAGTCR